ncbi:MAG: response regulator [Nitrospirales bacterium]
MTERVRQLLVIDDDPDDMLLFQESLKETPLKFSMTRFHTGHEAIAHLEFLSMSKAESLPDLIFLDFQLPEESGPDLIRIIRANTALRIVPIIILSGMENPTSIGECYLAGANCCVPKPSTLQEAVSLAQAIHDLWFSNSKLPSDSYQSEKNISQA